VVHCTDWEEGERMRNRDEFVARDNVSKKAGFNFLISGNKEDQSLFAPGKPIE
jgi:hypothetical protein